MRRSFGVDEDADSETVEDVDPGDVVIDVNSLPDIVMRPEVRGNRPPVI
jgi:hypothetical protein